MTSQRIQSHHHPVYHIDIGKYETPISKTTDSFRLKLANIQTLLNSCEWVNNQKIQKKLLTEVAHLNDDLDKIGMLSSDNRDKLHGLLVDMKKMTKQLYTKTNKPVDKKVLDVVTNEIDVIDAAVKFLPAKQQKKSRNAHGKIS